jgi:hypothetical protein
MLVLTDSSVGADQLQHWCRPILLLVLTDCNIGADRFANSPKSALYFCLQINKKFGE